MNKAFLNYLRSKKNFDQWKSNYDDNLTNSSKKIREIVYSQLAENGSIIFFKQHDIIHMYLSSSLSYISIVT